MKNERKLALSSRIALAILGPILVKYLQNMSAITLRSVIDFPSHCKDEGSEGLIICLLITSFSNLLLP